MESPRFRTFVSLRTVTKFYESGSGSRVELGQYGMRVLSKRDRTFETFSKYPITLHVGHDS